MIKARINQWMGEGPQDPKAKCLVCRQPRTVAEIIVGGDVSVVRICKTCLAWAIDAIDRAILDYCRVARLRVDSDDDGYPD